MTTIAYDGRRIAVESMASWSDMIIPVDGNKLQLIKYRGKKYIATGAGTQMHFGALFRHTVDMIGRPHSWDRYAYDGETSSSVLVIRLDDIYAHSVFVTGEGGGVTELNNTPIAMGSGEGYALGAMFAGASAIEAVEAAIKYDKHSRGPVRHIDLWNLPPDEDFIELEDYDAKAEQE